MIVNYPNGEAFIVDNKDFLEQNIYMSSFFFLDAPLLKEASNNNLALVCTEKDAIKIKSEMAEKMDLNVLRIKSEPVSGGSFLIRLGL